MQSSADHGDRVRNAETAASIADTLRGDFAAFKSALIPLEGYFRDLWASMKFDPTTKESLVALFTEQKKRCEVTGHLLDNIVSRYDRFLGLVSYLHLHSSCRLIKHVTAAELHQYPDGRRDEACFRTKCRNDSHYGRPHEADCRGNDTDEELDKTKCRSNTENGTARRTGSKTVNTERPTGAGIV